MTIWLNATICSDELVDSSAANRSEIATIPSPGRPIRTQRIVSSYESGSNSIHPLANFCCYSRHVRERIAPRTFTCFHMSLRFKNLDSPITLNPFVSQSQIFKTVSESCQASSTLL